MAEGFVHIPLLHLATQVGPTPVSLHHYQSEGYLLPHDSPLYVDARDVREAQALIARFGVGAAQEAANRAASSRNVGNHIHFCRWRQIERLVALLSQPAASGTVH